MRSLNVADIYADPSAFRWRKSSRSAANGNCVEVTGFPGPRIAVRDSKNRSGTPVVLAASDWRAFLDRVKSGTLPS